MRNCLILISRLFLAMVYLWVVADRLGFLGKVGNTGVVWGDFDTFLDYTATLNPWFSRGLSNILGYFVTIIEVVFSVLFLLKIRLKETALASFSILSIFTISMIFSLGITEGLEFILFTVVLMVISWFIYVDGKNKVK